MNGRPYPHVAVPHSDSKLRTLLFQAAEVALMMASRCRAASESAHRRLLNGRDSLRVLVAKYWQSMQLRKSLARV